METISIVIPKGKRGYSIQSSARSGSRVIADLWSIPPIARISCLLGLIILISLFWKQDSSAQQDINSFVFKSADATESKTGEFLKNLEKKVSTLSENTLLKAELNDIIAKLKARQEIDSLRKVIEECNNEQVRTILTEILNKYDMSNAFTLSTDLGFNSSTEGGSIITPTLNAFYRIPFASSKKLTFESDFILNFNSNISSTDSIAVTNRVLRTGADGVVSVQPKLKLEFKDSFIAVASVIGSLSWLSTKPITDTTTTPDFGYFSAGFSIGLKAGPFVAAIQRVYNFTKDAEDNTYSRQLHNSFSDRVLIGLKFNNGGQLQLNYLVNTNKPYESSDNLLIKLGASFDL